MSRHHVEIGSEGLRHSLRVDGHDLSKGATGLTLSMGLAGTLPVLQVDLQLIDVSTVGSIEAEVVPGRRRARGARGSRVDPAGRRLIVTEGDPDS